MTISELLPYLGGLSLIITIGVAIGSFSFRNGRQTQLAKFQNDTNTALQQRVAALEGKAADLEKENIIQRHLIDTMVMALEQRGLIITISGDMVSIEDKKTGLRSQHRKRMGGPHQASVAKKEDE